MGVKRVQMAAEAGANDDCDCLPFLHGDIEDAIKVTGLKGRDGIDLTELVDRQSRANGEWGENSKAVAGSATA